MANFCSNCGVTTTPEIRFCGNCGSKVNDSGQSSSHVAIPTASTALPTPPPLHWAIVLILSVLTLGIFFMIWWFIVTMWVKRLTGSDKPLIWFAVAVVLEVAIFLNPVSSPVPFIVFMFGCFSIRKYVLAHYNSIEPIQLEIGQ